MNREQLKKLERDLWAAADKLRANSDLILMAYEGRAPNPAAGHADSDAPGTSPVGA